MNQTFAYGFREKITDCESIKELAYSAQLLLMES